MVDEPTQSGADTTETAPAAVAEAPKKTRSRRPKKAVESESPQAVSAAETSVIQPSVDGAISDGAISDGATSEGATSEGAPAKATRSRTRKAAAPKSSDAAEAPIATADDGGQEDSGEAGDKKPAKRTTAKRTTAKRATAKQAAAPQSPEVPVTEPVAQAESTQAESTQAESAQAESTQTEATGPEQPAKKPRRSSRTRKSAAAAAEAEQPALIEVPDDSLAAPDADADEEEAIEEGAEASPVRPAATALLFQAPDPTAARPSRRTRGSAAQKAAAKSTEGPAGSVGSAGAADADQPAEGDEVVDEAVEGTLIEAADGVESSEAGDSQESGDETGEGGARRRRRRGGRRRRKAGEDAGAEGEDGEDSAEESATSAAGESEGSATEGGTRRRRRRVRAGDDNSETGDDPENTVTRVRARRSAEDEITAVSGSTRLEAKKQRRREGREAGRRRAPIVSEAEFLARRESVDRVMVIRQRGGLTQIAVLEDKVLVEHYVAQESQTSLIGNVYLGRVQNVLPSMEAAFIDIGKGRNAVLYAGEVNWSALGHKDGQPRKIESVLSSGQSVLVQVTKDPVGHKGARLTSQVSLAGRFLVYVPDGTTSGISRKLPDTERNRLKRLLKEIVPDTAGVIVRTAAEGASEDELTRDVERLKARWEDIEAKVAKGNAPTLLYGEPDLTLKVVRDLFTEDFSRLVIEGNDAWDTVQGYVAHVAPDLEQRLERYQPGDGGGDVFSAYRIDEQIAKGLDRKVWLPSGGSLIIDRTEAMTVVDVNTGKFTGSGGNLEETVTRNNLEAAEEIVRQLRLRDIGGIIVVDFIDMVLESNRDLVLRRLVECLGRDRTRHQVAEVTSLGLVQMTRKRIGTGLLEAFSESCDHCSGRGVVLQELPVEPRRGEEERRTSRRRRGGRGDNAATNGEAARPVPSPRDIAAVARPESESAAAADVEDDAVDLPHADPTPALEHVAAQEAEEVAAAEPTDVPGAEQAESEQAESEQAEPDQAEPEQAEPEQAEPDQAEPEQGEPEQGEPDGTAAGAPVDEQHTPELPPPPRVVTRTRRRAASRAAGPPVVVEEEPFEVSEPGTEDGQSDDEHLDGEHQSVEHVPIKRKGARKR